MEQKSYVLEQIKLAVESKVNLLLTCDSKSLPNAYRMLNEVIQEYCTYRTMYEKYSNNENEEDKKA